ncbi:MerR family DNA-binding transcriptional regulator [Amycolatopsis samaneae]|uniref:MerR family DNA-binding transcriptional regulator n=1 Tax=Amycolatopsis samaneae TaxID=664691 RepID=A0ABW5GV11_9PSEU
MSTVTIGEAAALYRLSPATLRWWERQGLLGSPGREGGRRCYRAEDLRRVGLAYLCRVAGMMPLDKAAIVTAGHAGLATWQATVREEIDRLQERITRLGAARDYLAHLLSCVDDDVVTCPYLDHELTTHTPRGRVPEPDILAAARAATRDESTPAGDETRCPGCHGSLPRATRGRPRRYCSHACRQRAYRARHRVR